MNETNNPISISVVIATKNGSKHIASALKNVLAQDYATGLKTRDALEIIVVSDGSTDATVDIVRDIADKDARIKLLVLAKNIGPGLARNAGVRLAEGEFIAFLDDDDLWLDTNKLKNQSLYLASNPRVVAVGSSKAEYKNEKTGLVKEVSFEKDWQHIYKNMLSRNPLLTSATMLKKAAFERVGGFNALYLAEDYDLWVRMGLIGEIQNIDGAKTLYLVRMSSASRSRKVSMYWNIFKLGIKYRKSYPSAYKGTAKRIRRVLASVFK